MKPIRVDVKLRNNRLVERRETLGVSSVEFARMIGMSPTTYCKFEAMTLSPFRANKAEYRDVANRIAEYWRVPTEDLFPAIVHQVKKRSGSFTVDEHQVEALMQSSFSRDTLPMLPEEAHDRVVEIREIRSIAGSFMDEYSSQSKACARRVAMLKMRLGWDNGVECTFEEIGSRFNVGRDRARQIIEKMLRIMRHSTNLGKPLLDFA